MHSARGNPRAPGATLPQHTALLQPLEDFSWNFRLFPPLLGIYFNCGLEDRNSWAVEVNSLRLPQGPDCVGIGNVRYTFRCLDVQSRARSAYVSSESQKGPVPVLRKCFSLVGRREDQVPCQFPFKCPGSAALSGEGSVQEIGGCREAGTKNMPS